MTHNPIKQDFSKHKEVPSDDNKVKYGLARRCRDYAGRWVREKFTPGKVINAVFPEKRELVATPLEILIAGTMIANLKLFEDPLKDLKGILYFGRHATNTVIDAARGGPEGMRAAIDLEKAIKILEKEAETNQEAAELVKTYYSSKKEFVQELVRVYKENETFARVCQRLQVQLQGMKKKAEDLGNSLKPEFMRKVDREIIINFVKFNRGWNPFYESYKGLSDEAILEKAIRTDEKLSSFYEDVLEFYNAREFNEKTVGEFCRFMTKTQNMTLENNEKLEAAFGPVIALVKKGYSIEDIIFEMNAKGIFVSDQEVENLGGKVKDYDQEGKDVRATTEAAGVPAPKEPFFGYNIIDIVTNPYVIAIAGVVAYKGLTRFTPGLGFVDRQLSKVVCLPVSAGVSVSKAIYNKSASYIKERRANKPKEEEQNEDTEGTSN